MSFICVLTVLLFLQPLGLIAQANAAAQKPKPTPLAYSNHECGFELRVADWNVTVKPPEHPTRPCDLIVTFFRHSSDKSIETHSVHLIMLDEDYETALRDAGLVQKNGAWLTEGRQGMLSPPKGDPRGNLGWPKGVHYGWLLRR
jgi:hypothetical protein